MRAVLIGIDIDGGWGWGMVSLVKEPERDNERHTYVSYIHTSGGCCREDVDRTVHSTVRLSSFFSVCRSVVLGLDFYWYSSSGRKTVVAVAGG